MPEPALFILYVEDVPASTAFYASLLGLAPIEQSPAFAMFALASGVKLGLWARSTVAPDATLTGGGVELAFPAADVDAVHADWVARGLPILQPPIRMEFGRTFTACDPDGHRLRVYAPGGD